MKPVGLVSCCKTKLDHAAPAAQLYQGSLFKLSVRWLMPRVDGWAILSAMHGVVLPETVIHPYDSSLVGAREARVREWAEMAAFDLRELFPGRKFLAICGKDYASCLEGLDCEQAFAGLKLGDKLHALKEATNGQAD